MAKIAIVFEDEKESEGVKVELLTDQPDDCQGEETPAQRMAGGLWEIVSSLIQEAQSQE